ncbi:hypothetical protein [Rhodobacteraceae bacterium DSL-40]|uniref:sulfotransferase family protein n=1 Tax=Amaricoccus sp. B4 TaxID=3368557 RepID=UPI000DAEACC7
MKNCAVLIIGMDRSGTSAIAAVSQIVGLHLGDQLIGPRKANPKGYFEDSRCVSINEELLAHLRHGRRNASTLPKGWKNNLAAKHAALRMANVIRRLSKKKPFGLKDPRFCLTAPLWLRELGKNKFQTKVVLCVRNPLEVASSLEKRDGRNRTGSCLMWITHTLAALEASKDLERIIVEYPDLMSDPVGTGLRLKTFFQTGTEISDQEKEKILDFVDPALWKNRAEISGENYIETVALDLYEAMRSGDESRIAAFVETGPGFLVSTLETHAALAIGSVLFQKPSAELAAEES